MDNKTYLVIDNFCAFIERYLYEKRNDDIKEYQKNHKDLRLGLSSFKTKSDVSSLLDGNCYWLNIYTAKNGDVSLNTRVFELSDYIKKNKKYSPNIGQISTEIDKDSLEIYEKGSYQEERTYTSCHDEKYVQKQGSYTVRDVFNNGNYTVSYTPDQIGHRSVKSSSTKKITVYTLDINVVIKAKDLTSEDKKLIKEYKEKINQNNKNLKELDTLGLFNLSRKNEIYKERDSLPDYSFKVGLKLLYNHFFYLFKEASNKLDSKISDVESEIQANEAECKKAALTAFAYKKKLNGIIKDLKEKNKDIVKTKKILTDLQSNVETLYNTL